jgi:hypothetical protein
MKNPFAYIIINLKFHWNLCSGESILMHSIPDNSLGRLCSFTYQSIFIYVFEHKLNILRYIPVLEAPKISLFL